jgi:hypothetical protein
LAALRADCGCGCHSVASHVMRVTQQQTVLERVAVNREKFVNR